MMKNRGGWAYRFSDETICEWVWLYTINMWSTCRIANEYGCNVSTVNKHLNKLGIKIRSSKEALNLPYPKQKISETHKGKKKSEEHKRKVGVANKGKSCGPKNGMYGKTGVANHRYGEHHTEETKRLISAATAGPKNGSWAGGRSYLSYSRSFNSKKKLQIKRRDNFTCQHPECGECRGCLTVHHIDYDKRNSKDTNLITLCKSHNTKVNQNREYWMQYFKKLVNFTIKAYVDNYSSALTASIIF